MSGSVTVMGSKNSVLPLLAATLLTRDECVITRVPDIVDVQNFTKILEKLGSKVIRKNKSLKVCCGELKSDCPDKKLVGSMRASIVLLGGLLGRLHKARLAHPGGDLIGARPIDVHLRAFRSMGANIAEGEIINATAKKLKGAEVYAESSVTGTENIILAAVLAKGRTVIKLAAQEPHVEALCKFLNLMGAKIVGVGTHTLIINGVKNLHGAKIEVIPDMIEAGSFAVLAAVTKGNVEIKGVNHNHMDAVYNKLAEMGVNFEKTGSNLYIRPSGGAYSAASIRTGYYPNLATDLQPPFGVLATQAKGCSSIHDWIWEGRLGYLYELKKMGANVTIMNPHQAQVFGPTDLRGSVIDSLDIRSGMTLVIASLAAIGRSEIKNIHHIDRGYEHIDERLRALGADIRRVES